MDSIIKRQDEEFEKKFFQDTTGEKIEGWLAMSTGKLIKDSEEEFCKIATTQDVSAFFNKCRREVLEYVAEECEKQIKHLYLDGGFQGAVKLTREDVRVRSHNYALNDAIRVLSSHFHQAAEGLIEQKQ